MFFMEKNLTPIWIMILIAFVAISFIFAKTIVVSTDSKSTINSDGKHEMTVAPDRAKVYAGISVLKSNPTDAQNNANEIITQIIKALNEKGISSADIETENFNLYEEKTWTKDGEKSLGWRATQTLIIKTKDLTKTGEIVDIAVENNANQINSIQFYLSPEKENEYKREAITIASKNAKEKAEAMAQSLGLKLGKIKTVSESSFDYYPYSYDMKNNAGVGAIEESSTVMPRDVTVRTTINLVYELK